MSETSTLPAAAQAASALALVAAQPGIWMADQLSPHGNAFTVAHYLEINGPLDLACMTQAIVLGLNEADTVSMRFEERDGIALQTPCALAPDFQPECMDLRQSADAEQAALALMRQDLAAELRILSGKTLHRHVLIRVGEARWFWYQRYHHIQVDGFSFTAIARRIADIYTALCRQQTPEPSPFVPFSEVVEEVEHYQQGAAFERDAKFWREKALTLPAPATLCPQPLAGQVPSVRLHRVSCACDASQIESLTSMAQQYSLTVSDIAIALVALWVSRLSGQTDFCGGFIFMRRMGSAALCATGPVINVLPVAMNVDPAATLAELAVRLRDELKKVRRHQRYDAEQITRDLGMAGDAQPLYGTVFNFKMFDYQIDFNGVPGITHDLASGPVRDLEIALHISDDGALTVDLQANAERYDRDELEAHVQRLPLLLRQFAENNLLPVGAADLLNVADHSLLERVNLTAHPVVKSTLSQQLAQQAERTPHAPALVDQQHQFSYAETRQQVVALAQQLTQQGVKRGDIVAAIGVSVTGADGDCRGGRSLPAARYRLPRRAPAYDAGRRHSAPDHHTSRPVGALCRAGARAAGGSAVQCGHDWRHFAECAHAGTRGVPDLHLGFDRPAERRSGGASGHRQPAAVDAGSLSDRQSGRGIAENSVQLRRLGLGVFLAADGRCPLSDGTAGSTP